MKVNITCRYGDVSKLHPHGHTGIDLGFAEGTPLRAIRSGVAHLVDYGDKNVGKGVLIEHADGSREIYGHLKDFTVRDGQQVYAGEQIGYTGNTGHSTGPHLHFGMKDSSGHYVDPTAHAGQVADLAGGHVTHWYDILTTTKGVMYDFAVNPKEWFYEKVQYLVEGGLLDLLTDCVSALPICAVVGGSVYILINCFSKKLAKIGFAGTVIYGLFVARGL